MRTFGVRYAPSPTGRFHVGNLRTAWIAGRIAKIVGEPFVIRFEDIDRARVLEGAEQGQLDDLRRLGLPVDHIVRQSARLPRHQELFQLALKENRIYACDCSRAEVRKAVSEVASAPHGRQPEYSGRCRALNRTSLDFSQINSKIKAVESVAWRWRDDDESGRLDSVVARTDVTTKVFYSGYHWSCAVDDAEGQYTWLVRAWDLATAEATQSPIRQWVCGKLNQSASLSRVYHTALITADNGMRLEKRTLGVTLLEMERSGITIDQLIQCFADSFEEPSAKVLHQLEPASGEAKQQLTLRELGLRIAHEFRDSSN